MWAGVFLIFLVVGITLVLVFVPSATASKQSEARIVQTSSREVAPLTAHFIYGLWDTKPMKESFVKNIRQWSDQGWKVKQWDKQMVETLIHDHFPQYEQFYHSLPRGAQKADFARYLIVYLEGHFYFDLDCMPKNSKQLLDKIRLPLDRMYTFIETTITKEYAMKMAKKHKIRNGVPERLQRLANYAFGAPAKHPALLKVIQLAVERCTTNPEISDDYAVIWSTGPDVVSEALADETEHIERWDHSEWFTHQCAHTWVSKKDQ